MAEFQIRAFILNVQEHKFFFIGEDDDDRCTIPRCPPASFTRLRGKGVKVDGQSPKTSLIATKHRRLPTLTQPFSAAMFRTPSFGSDQGKTATRPVYEIFGKFG